MAWGLVFYLPWARGTVDHIRQCQVQHQREVFYVMEQKPGAYIRPDQENASEKPATLHTWTQSPVLGGLGPALPHWGWEGWLMLGFGGCRKGERSILALFPGSLFKQPRVIPNAQGTVGKGVPKATPGPSSASGLLSPPCYRDLKRDVAKKLEKLEKRTQRAIAELIRKCRAWQGRSSALRVVAQARGSSRPLLSAIYPGERLKGQEDSLASAVDATTGQEACDSD